MLGRWPLNKRYAVILQHDVDYPVMIKWVEVLRKSSKAMDIIMGKEHFWRFKDWIALERKYGMKSAFYFCGLKSNLLRYIHIPDPFYDVRGNKFRQIMKFIIDEGFEVGMHASCSAYQSEENFSGEKKRIEEVLGYQVYGNTHHYSQLNYQDPSATLLIHHRIGLIYDSSINFRLARTCLPFHLNDPLNNKEIATLELPITLTDSQLFNYVPRQQHFPKKNFEQCKREIDILLDSVKQAGGLFVANYHVRVFNDTFFPGWKQSYEYLLHKITQCTDYYCDTPLNIAKYWLENENRSPDK